MAEGKKNKKNALASMVRLRLQDPTTVRITSLAFTVLVGLVGFGVPLQNRLKAVEDSLFQEKLRKAHIEEYDYINERLEAYKSKLPSTPNLDWWNAYLLEASRKFNLMVVQFKPQMIKGPHTRAGALQGVKLKIDVRGHFMDIVRFVNWAENQEIVARIVQINMKEEGSLTAAIIFGVYTDQSDVSQSPEKKDDTSADEDPGHQVGDFAQKEADGNTTEATDAP